MRYPAIKDVAHFLSAVYHADYDPRVCWAQYCGGTENDQRYYCENYLLVLAARFRAVTEKEPTERQLLAMWCWQGGGPRKVARGEKHWPEQVRNYVNRVQNIEMESR